MRILIFLNQHIRSNYPNLMEIQFSNYLWLENIKIIRFIVVTAMIKRMRKEKKIFWHYNHNSFHLLRIFDWSFLFSLLFFASFRNSYIKTFPSFCDTILIQFCLWFLCSVHFKLLLCDDSFTSGILTAF